VEVLWEKIAAWKQLKEMLPLEGDAAAANDVERVPKQSVTRRKLPVVPRLGTKKPVKMKGKKGEASKKASSSSKPQAETHRVVSLAQRMEES